MALRGIRGATVCEQNTRESILDATRDLLQQLLNKNQIVEADVASIFFSLTPDLNAVFPALAARELGFLDAPLLCVTEVPVPNALGRCIRILIHVNTDKRQSDMLHLYLKEAVVLRPDRKISGGE